MDDSDQDMKLGERLDPVARPWRHTRPHWAYFQRADGPMFCWHTDRQSNGSWNSFVYERHSFGWTVTKGSITSHRLRREAKARALALFEGWCLGGNGKRPW